MTGYDVAAQFRRAWVSLLPIGRDSRTSGYTRLAWTRADLACRDWFRAQAAARDMAVYPDRAGNLWAWWGGPGPGAVVTGSHLDAVPGGGAYDGPLGVISAFLAIDVLRARDVRPARPVAVSAFVDEEGGRFGVACLGSRVLTGTLDPEAARRLRDTDGVMLAEAMRAAGADPNALGSDPDALCHIAAFVELHIEQGRALVDRGAPVAVADTVWPHGRWRFTFRGEGNHAGTTRTVDRRDPMLAFAALVMAARDATAGTEALSTVGRVQADPGAANAIARTVDAWLDARAPDDPTLSEVVAAARATAEQAAAGHGVTVECERQSYTPVVEFDHALRDRIIGVISAAGLPAPTLPTGAGHDAGVLAAHVPAAMLFVRNPTGVSHAPDEHATADDCVTGIEVLADVLEDLAREPVPLDGHGTHR